MSATTAITGVSSIFDGVTGILSSMGKNVATKAQNDISASFQIADVVSKSESAASDMRIKALGYDNDAVNIRRNLKNDIKLFDEKANASAGSLKADYASSGVALNGSALEVIAAAENSVALQRLARQHNADSEASEREFMARQLRLGAKFTQDSMKDKAARIKLGANIGNAFNSAALATSVISDSFDTIFDVMKGLSKG